MKTSQGVLEWHPFPMEGILPPVGQKLVHGGQFGALQSATVCEHIQNLTEVLRRHGGVIRKVPEVSIEGQ